MRRTISITLMAVLLISCAHTPPYVPAGGSPIAQLNLSQSGELTLCTQGQRFALKPNEQKYAAVPAGQRVTVNHSFFAQGYNVNYSCHSGISFIPEAGQSYFTNFELRNERCILMVFREDSRSRVGLTLEPSMGRPLACEGA